MLKLTSRMRDELDLMIENNTGLYEELYNEAFKDISKSLEKIL